MLENIELLNHNCIRFQKGNMIYSDPFQLKDFPHDADLILITHSHYDHFSEEDIKKVKNESTIIVITEDLYDKTMELGFKEDQIVKIKPNEKYKILGIEIETIPAYNTKKLFHPKENNWVGYRFKLENTIYYIAGDTDITEENKKIICDVAFLPIGGTYTMNAREAAELANKIRPSIAVPVHYGSIVGTKQDAESFVQSLEEGIEGKILTCHKK